MTTVIDCVLGGGSLVVVLEDVFLPILIPKQKHITQNTGIEIIH
jgi:hypothetical protein